MCRVVWGIEHHGRAQWASRATSTGAVRVHLFRWFVRHHARSRLELLPERLRDRMCGVRDVLIELSTAIRTGFDSAWDKCPPTDPLVCGGVYRSLQHRALSSLVPRAVAVLTEYRSIHFNSISTTSMAVAPTFVRECVVPISCH